MTVLRRAEPGTTYNIGSCSERRNVDIVKQICDLVDELAQPLPSGPRRNLIQFAEDRPGHDKRYAMDASKLRIDLGWRPVHDIDSGLRNTVQWYLENESWWRPLLDEQDALGRLGISRRNATRASGHLRAL